MDKTKADVSLSSDAGSQLVSSQEASALAADLPILGKSAAIRRVTHLATKVAPTDSTVLITGETGTGKELLARTIHALSPRRYKPFVAVNTSAIPESLQESELFGHSRGAFTGAVNDRKGLFEEANKGTLFLDEIGDTSLLLQVKLLRALENREVRAVGTSEERKVDARVIAATNRDLAALVKRGSFREDLFFRLNVMHLHLPPLRERREDIELLLYFFFERYQRRFGKKLKGFSDEALQMLKNYNYPGNVRELDNMVQHAILMAEEDLVQPADLPLFLTSPIGLPAPEGTPPRGETLEPDWEVVDQPPSGQAGKVFNFNDERFMTIAEMEKQLILYTLGRLGGNQSLAARKLGISRSTLWRKMKEHQIKG